MPDIVLNQVDGSHPTQTINPDGLWQVQVFHGPTATPEFVITGLASESDANDIAKNRLARGASRCIVSLGADPFAVTNVVQENEGSGHATASWTPSFRPVPGYANTKISFAVDGIGTTAPTAALGSDSQSTLATANPWWSAGMGYFGAEGQVIITTHGDADHPSLPAPWNSPPQPADTAPTGTDAGTHHVALTLLVLEGAATYTVFASNDGGSTFLLEFDGLVSLTPTVNVGSSGTWNFTYQGVSSDAVFGGISPLSSPVVVL